MFVWLTWARDDRLASRNTNSSESEGVAEGDNEKDDGTNSEWEPVGQSPVEEQERSLDEEDGGWIHDFSELAGPPIGHVSFPRSVPSSTEVAWTRESC